MSEQNNEIYLNLNLVGVNKKLNFNYISMRVSHVEKKILHFMVREGGKGRFSLKVCIAISQKINIVGQVQDVLTLKPRDRR